MSWIRSSDFEPRYAHAKTGLQRGDLAITWMFKENAFAFLDKPMMNVQMKAWRRQAKAGKLIIRRCNNKTTTTRCGDTLHFLVMQSRDSGENPPNPFGSMVLSELVSGFIYAFYNKANRDMVHAYVMRGVHDDSDE